MPKCAMKRRRGRDSRDAMQNGNQNQPARSQGHHMPKSFKTRPLKTAIVVIEEERT